MGLRLGENCRSSQDLMAGRLHWHPAKGVHGVASFVQNVIVIFPFCRF